MKPTHIITFGGSHRQNRKLSTLLRVMLSELALQAFYPAALYSKRLRASVYRKLSPEEIVALRAKGFSVKNA